MVLIYQQRLDLVEKVSSPHAINYNSNFNREKCSYSTMLRARILHLIKNIYEKKTIDIFLMHAIDIFLMHAIVGISITALVNS